MATSRLRQVVLRRADCWRALRFGPARRTNTHEAGDDAERRMGPRATWPETPRRAVEAQQLPRASEPAYALDRVQIRRSLGLAGLPTPNDATEHRTSASAPGRRTKPTRHARVRPLQYERERRSARPMWAVAPIRDRIVARRLVGSTLQPGPTSHPRWSRRPGSTAALESAGIGRRRNSGLTLRPSPPARDARCGPTGFPRLRDFPRRFAARLLLGHVARLRLRRGFLWVVKESGSVLLRSTTG
jgi:hypothetical protein